MTVRAVVPGERGPSGGPALTDVVGRVLRVTQTSADVERRDGQVVAVVLGDVVGVRVVPDAPRRTRDPLTTSADDLTRVATRGWPPLESEPLGDWLLRAAGGFTGRANSVAVHGDPGTGASDALARVQAYYAARDLPARAQVVVGSGWERTFEAAGWAPLPDANPGAVVQVAVLAEALAACGEARRGVVVDEHLTDDWAAAYHRAAGADGDVVRAVLTGPPTTGFVSVRDDAGALQAVGRVVVTGEWAGLSAVEVSPALRRGGLGRAVVEASLRWASDRGADKAYLQTMRPNTAAIALYAGYGFVDHHDYRYLSPPRA
ncbi:GNAT family N-acetyltransferase [Solicola sp. PLA-1-18]|uniref:GNAT family N-acetyltransferase n=1 Tax=Solicola sp. PLA-1-18 TaxID=3380532 RepID=UPI003B7CE1A0